MRGSGRLWPGRFTLLPPGFRLCFDLGIQLSVIRSPALQA
jgi:hypothetical protein